VFPAGRAADFLADVAASNRGRYLEYVSACGLPARVVNIETAQDVHASRCATLSRENAVVYAEAQADYSVEASKVKLRNETRVNAAAAERAEQANPNPKP